MIPTGTKALNIGTPVNRGAALNRGLVNWWFAVPNWKGLQFRDLCGRNHGTLTSGPTWQGTRGRLGGLGAVSLATATSQSVNLGIGVVDFGTADFTFTAQFYCPTIGNGRTVFHKGTAGTTEMLVEIANPVVDRVVVARVGSSPVTTVNGTTIIVANVWYHVAVVRTGGNVYLYINGKLDASTADGGGTMTSARASYIGAASYGNQLGGLIDDISFRTAGLSSDGVSSLYREAIQGYQNTLNWYRPLRVDVPAAAGGGGSELLPKMMQYGLYVSSGV